VNISVLDISARQKNPPPPTVRMREGKRVVIAKAEVIRGRAIERDMRDVKGWTLHQTACYFGSGKLRPGEDRQTKIHERALNVHAHRTCFGSGTSVLAYPRTWKVYASHDFCSDTIGQEHEGHFDEDGNPIDPPAGYSLEAVIYAGRAGIESDIEFMPNAEYIRLHRQTTNKPHCPGPIITREVGMWACKRFGLRFDPDLTRRNGTPIPKTWLVEPRLA
jgi:hypothetical protein